MERSVGSDVLILCYHAVSESWPSVTAVKPGAFERQVGHLLGRGYRPRTLAGALAAPAGERTLVLTFDDAFGSVVERALPILTRHEVPATLFVPTDFAAEAASMTWSTLGRWMGTPHEHELSCMSWEDVRRLAAAGWEIGSHTCSHPDLTAVDAGAAAAELSRSRQACEAALQRECTSLAYPFGAHDRGVVALAGDAGYERAVTLGDRLLSPRSRGVALELSREGVYRNTRWPHFLAATSPLLGRARGLGLYRKLAPG